MKSSNTRRVIIVVGGQYGSEAKGKIVQRLAWECEQVGKPCLAVRCGGPNAGHTVEWAGKLEGDNLEGAVTELKRPRNRNRFATRSLSSAFLNPQAELQIAAGAIVDPNQLHKEIRELTHGYGIEVTSRLFIDPNAAILADRHRDIEATQDMTAYQGSTGSGTGAAMAERVMRNPRLKRAADMAMLRGNLRSCATAVNTHADQGGTVIVEGTQGYGLSLYHANCWPYTTSRDTSAAAFCSEAGLAPQMVTDVIMVVRAYPIRVGGNSGPIERETTWQQVEQDSGYALTGTSLQEITTVTKRVRRVGKFDWDLLDRAVMVNRPTSLALHGADHVAVANLGARTWDGLTLETRRFVTSIEDRTGVPVGYVMTGPQGDQMVVRDEE